MGGGGEGEGRDVRPTGGKIASIAIAIVLKIHTAIQLLILESLTVFYS